MNNDDEWWITMFLRIYFLLGLCPIVCPNKWVLRIVELVENVINFPIFRKKLFYAECSNSFDFGIIYFFCKFLEVKSFHQGGKISTSLIWVEIWQTQRYRNRNFYFLEVNNFFTKVEKLSFFLFGMEFRKWDGPDADKKKFSKGENFHLKRKFFHFCIMFQFMWFWKKNFFIWK